MVRFKIDDVAAEAAAFPFPFPPFPIFLFTGSSNLIS